MTGKPDSVIRIQCPLDKTFFKYWLMFLSPFHKLTDREIDVTSSLLKQRYELSHVISDSDILDKVMMSDDVKKKVRDECNITFSHFQVILSKLKKNKVIVDNKINKKFIPNINNSVNSFGLLLYFDLK